MSLSSCLAILILKWILFILRIVFVVTLNLHVVSCCVHISSGLTLLVIQLTLDLPLTHCRLLALL